MGFSPVTGTAMDMSDALYGGPEEFGMHPAIQSVDRGLIRVEHKAKFKKVCLYCDPCSGVLNRKYFSVLENGYEANHPVGAILCCFTLPPNCCCPGVDYISKSYFDRGVYDMQTCAWRSGCIRGAPSIMENERKRVCCCMPCCKCYNQFVECYAPSCCGERVRVIPHETCFCCLSNRASCCSNCCGLHGLATGEPLCINGCLVSSLIDGEGAKLAYSLNLHRAKWVDRVNSTRA